jgi:hypothetical protein
VNLPADDNISREGRISEVTNIRVIPVKMWV